MKPYICIPKPKKMIKKLSSLLVAATVLTLAVGCKGKNSVSNDPKAVLVAFFDKMGKKDFDGAAKLATKDSKSTMEMMKKAMEAAEKMGMKDKTKEEDPSEEFRNMKVGEAKIDGDNATVSVSNPKKDNNIVDFPLKKEGGSWKVDFSMGTLMKMGMDQAGKENNMMNDSDLKDKMEGLPQNLEGMTDSLSKSMEKLQEEMKKIDPKQMEEAMKALEKLKQ